MTIVIVSLNKLTRSLISLKLEERVVLDFFGWEKAFMKLSISAGLPEKQALCYKIKPRKLRIKGNREGEISAM